MRPQLILNAIRSRRLVRLRRPQLRVEALEDRAVPTVYWNGGGQNHNWNTAANWSTDLPPGPGDDVVIDFGTNDFTVTLSGDSAAVHSLTCEASLEVSGASLTLSANSAISKSLSLSGPLEGSGNLTIGGALNWLGGWGMTGTGTTTVLPTGTLLMDVGTLDGRRLVNQGRGTWADSRDRGRIDLLHGAEFVNEGTLDVQTVGEHWVWGRDLTGSTGAFINRGTITKISDVDPILVFGGATFENDGELRLGADTGRWYADGGASTSSGSFAVAAGASLTLANATLSGPGSEVTGAGEVHLNGVTVAGTYNVTGSTTVFGGLTDFTGTVTSVGDLSVGATASFLPVSGPATLTIPNLTVSGTLNGTDDLRVTGLFTWAGGALQGVNGHGTLTALGTSVLTGGTVNEFQVTNAGMLDWTAGNVSFFGPTSSFTNAAGATFDDQVDGVFGTADANMQVFNNEGLFIKSGGDGTTFLRMQLVNSGFIDVRRGTLDITNYIPNGGGGSGDIHGGIDNGGDGRSDPGPSQPTYTSFRQRASGSLTVTIRGLAAGTQYGQISVNGSVELDGTLKVIMNPLPGYTPAVGQTFAIINDKSTDAIVGTFANPAPGTMLWDTTHRFGFDVSYTTAYGSDGIANDVVLTLVVANSAPTANAGGPYSITEGASLSLDASGSSDPDGDALTYSWDVNGDGTFGDATGVSPTLTWAQLQALGIDDGPHAFNVQVRVDDGNAHVVDSSAAPLTLANTAPTAILSNGGTVTYGQSISASFASAFDPSATDTTAGFHYAYSIDDDGSGLAAATYASATGDASHSYSGLGAGTHTIYARIIDKDDGYTQYSTSVTIDPATPVFSVTGTTIQTVGTPSVTLTGTLRAGLLVPTGNVTVALAGAGSQQVAVASDGTFSATFATAGLPVGAHTVTFEYAGDGNFNAASASGTLDDTYGVRALVQKSKDKKKGASLSIQLELLNARGQNISSANIAVSAWGISLADSGDVEGNVGVADPSQAGPRTMSDGFSFHGGANPSYNYAPTNLQGLTAGQTYRLYFQVAGDPLLHWVAFTL